uniref:Nematode cuticle collagen N-terminal domain-containing protein n=1 Tax=Trichuris muris TaxID=70415 RepID=A0A5S6R1A1_TRIMR
MVAVMGLLSGLVGTGLGLKNMVDITHLKEDMLRVYERQDQVETFVRESLRSELLFSHHLTGRGAAAIPHSDCSAIYINRSTTLDRLAVDRCPVERADGKQWIDSAFPPPTVRIGPFPPREGERARPMPSCEKCCPAGLPLDTMQFTQRKVQVCE